jgi:lysophospholipase L1-like esterase
MTDQFLKQYTSATLAAGGIHMLFKSDGETRTGRVYNKLYVEGTYDFSFLFSCVTDSTFADGAEIVRDMPAGSWTVYSASVAVSDTADPDKDKAPRTRLSFDGKSTKNVASGEAFTTDPVRLDVKKGQYLGIELTYAGRLLPCHRESIVPVFRQTPEGWVPDPDMPIPSMTGCSREVSMRVCFWGDSITQGIGTPFDSYMYYAARTAELIGYSGIAYWNIGMGWARADDAAADGIWMEHARQNDVVSVCFGVNDLQNGFTGEELIENLIRIVSSLKKAGCSVLVQTVPPFGNDPEFEKKRQIVNRFILNDPGLGADAVFDCGKILGKPDAPHLARYGDHPDAEGCRLWAEALAPVLRKLIDRKRCNNNP